MPRFFFEIAVDDKFPDPAGLDLADREAARLHAIEIAATHLHEIDRVSVERVVRVVIRDGDGETLDVVISTST